MAAKASTNPDLLSVEEAARALGVRHSLVRRLFERAELRGFRAGAAIRIYRHSVEEYIRERSNHQEEEVMESTVVEERIESEPMPKRKPRKRKQAFPDYYIEEMKRINGR